jgi:hypothetical protein
MRDITVIVTLKPWHVVLLAMVIAFTLGTFIGVAVGTFVI